jgi:DNA-binding transcriptional regulator GbsR (MarR family)
MRLTPVQEKFILHWGEMGTRWGITRSMAQIQALLLLSPEPLNAEEIASTLSVARSNASISLRDLQAWGIVRVAHVLGDRRDHFETIKDPWALFRVILEERKRREIDPTIAALNQCLEGATEEDSEARERIAEMLEFFELTSAWYRAVGRLPDKALIRFVKLGDKVPKVLGLDGEDD